LDDYGWGVSVGHFEAGMNADVHMEMGP
jgi:hypothetical protein